MLVFTKRRHEVGDFFLENVFRRFGPSATRRRVERIDRLIVVHRDDASGFVDGARGHRILSAGALVNLAGIAVADVVPFASVLAHVLHGVSSRGNRLGLQRLDLAECGGTQFIGYNAEQVVLDRQFVDDRERVARIHKDFDRSAIGSLADLQARRPG